MAGLTRHLLKLSKVLEIAGQARNDGSHLSTINPNA